jgi:hypothetical protein
MADKQLTQESSEQRHSAAIQLNMAEKQLTQESGEQRHSAAIQLKMADKQLTQESGEQRHCGHSAKHGREAADSRIR